VEKVGKDEATVEIKASCEEDLFGGNHNGWRQEGI